MGEDTEDEDVLLTATSVSVSDDDDNNWWCATEFIDEMLLPLTVSLALSCKQHHHLACTCQLQHLKTVIFTSDILPNWN